MENSKKIKIGIDARFYGPIGRGLGRYAQEMVDNIIKIDRHNDYVIFLRKENFNDLNVNGYSNVKKVLTEVRWYTLKEQFLMPYYIWREKLDLIHFLHFNVPFFVPTKFIVTIHDLILTKFKSNKATTLNPFIYRIKNFFYYQIIKNALKKSKKIITISEFSKNDIVDQFKIRGSKIEVTYCGVSDLSFKENKIISNNLTEEDILKEFDIKNQFLLYVGSAYPHKNLEFLIECFFEVYKKNNNLKLVLVGREDYFYKKLKNFSKTIFSSFGDNPIIFANYVPDEKLEILYKKALVYVFPSLYEGFGLPPLEAMSKGCPVLSSNSSCLPEVLQDSVIYFDPKDKLDFLNKLELITNNNELRHKMIEFGKSYYKKYNWEECAKKTWRIYLQ